jgi:hypothetical protein
MNLFHLLNGIRLPVLFRLIRRNGIDLNPKLIIKLILLFVNSIISSALTIVERKKYLKIVEDTIIDKPPVFIIGHWRTGSTYLHQLFSLDNQFTTPTILQSAIPDHFLFSTRYYLPIMKLVLPKTRMMDEVLTSPFSPQEDEFALIRMGSISPLEKLFFPPPEKYFLAGYDDYIPKGDQLEVWKQNLLTFYKKITFQTGKQIVSKNPFHTMRIELLAELFPGARFIYINRHPFDVIPSTIRMWNIIACSEILKKSWKKPGIPEVTKVLHDFNTYVSQQKPKLGDRFSEVAFENLEKDPLKELKRIYTELDFEFTTKFENEIVNFLETNKKYAKNSYVLTEEGKDIINNCLGIGNSD